MASLVDLIQMLDMATTKPGEQPQFGASLQRIFGQPLSTDAWAGPNRPVSGTGPTAPPSGYTPPPLTTALNSAVPPAAATGATAPPFSVNYSGLGSSLLGASGSMMQNAQAQAAQAQTQANQQIQSQLANQMNMARAMKGNSNNALTALQSIKQGPSYSDYLTARGGVGAAQPMTPRLQPRFVQPLPRLGTPSVNGYLRGRSNGL